MKKCRYFNFAAAFISVVFLAIMPYGALADDSESEFPQENAWYQATPSVVWFDDPESTTTLEVHIEGRSDVVHVWMTDLGSDEEEGKKELFDDGTHGDKTAGDNVFTLSDVMLPNFWSQTGFDNWWGMLRVELDDGTLTGNNYGMSVGMVSQEYKDAFPVQDFGGGLSATFYAFFIVDSQEQIFEGYPVSDFYCGQEYYDAARKLYSIFPDEFDFLTLMPGMQCFRSSDYAENVPYHVRVSNTVKNIGLPITDNTAKYGSDGRLMSFVYHSFGSIAIMDHEMGHAWSAYIGKKFAVIDEWSPHWNDMIDVQGQMGLYYFDDGNVGHFAYNGDETWHLVSNYDVEPYSPLELYVMGLIPSSEVPDMHILVNPDFTDVEHITADSYKTITMEQVVQSAGGERVPSYEDSQKDFNMAFVVAQDTEFNDAAYAYFSLMSRELMSLDPPRAYSSQAPFYWATGERATLNTYLGDYGVLSIQPTAVPTEVPTLEPTEEPTQETPEPEEAVEETSQMETNIQDESPTPEPEAKETGIISGKYLAAIIAALVLGLVLLIVFAVRGNTKK